jgi:hypothetical protein
VALTTVGLAAAPSPGAAAGTRAARLVAGPTDPAARIAELSAVVARRQTASTRVNTRIADTRRRLVQARLGETLSLARADELNMTASTARHDYEVARADAGRVAASLYRSAGSSSAIGNLLDSRTPSEFSYRQRITRQVGEVQRQVVQRALTLERTARVAAREAKRSQRVWHEKVVRYSAEVPELEAEVAELQASVSNARFWLARWQSIASGVGTPIMSRSVLGPSELAAWFTGTGRRARITVPIGELTRAYIEEGEAAGVRGDIAFAQSILETGSLYFPDGGQLDPGDNNFAGMDACDSCAHGRIFPDARTGVRAQVQQLRVYADPTLRNADLNPPAVNPKLDRHHLKGEVPTWDGLTHTWATADRYGDRILQIYAQILAWLTDRADI